MGKKTLFHHIALHTSTLGPVGHMPFGPGTWGAAVAACLVAFVPGCFLGHTMEVRLGIIVLLFIAGGFLTGRAAHLLNKKDPGCIVLDELVGQWLVYLPFTDLSGTALVAGFLFFRVFDIIKPFPIRQAEHWLPRGWGIMLDDIIAGIYAAIALALLRFFVLT